MPKIVRKMHKANAAAQAAILPKIPPEVLDQLVKGPMTAEAVEDASRAFKKALIERALGAEMSYAAAHDWKIAMNQFAILYQDRFTRTQP